MRILVTAGATQTPIDKVRAITNIFRGKTGARIAASFVGEGLNQVTLVTSMDPATLVSTIGEGPSLSMRKLFYRTYDELYDIMKKLITDGGYDVVIHSAAVSDYAVEGTYVRQNMKDGPVLNKIDSAGKVGSDHQELFLKLVPTVKIVDNIRKPWGFNGVLVKFKLQVGITDAKLLEIAARSRKQSQADIIVANCLEWCTERAYIINDATELHISRANLAGALKEAVEDAFGRKAH
jgi:phosphopantothenate-cysteine ligase/phosphopantothenoylcysteine decarboxylase/phosphopantothenate--cysteine ligase